MANKESVLELCDTDLDLPVIETGDVAPDLVHSTKKRVNVMSPDQSADPFDITSEVSKVPSQVPSEKTKLANQVPSEKTQLGTESNEVLVL